MPNVKSLTKMNKTNAKEQTRKDKLEADLMVFINGNIMRFKRRIHNLKVYAGNTKNNRRNKINSKKR